MTDPKRTIAEKLIGANCCAAASTFLSALAATLLSTSTLFVASPFISDHREGQIIGVVQTSATATGLSLTWVLVGGCLAIRHYSDREEIEECAECFNCKYFSVAAIDYLANPCSVHPVEKPQPQCLDWAAIAPPQQSKK
ncbi:hypothetical protein IQ268_08675 [Oculatella sp. LEGE 06141]|uniref:hypothetical protein n=1 Tax=Oculatella sp. LEGE 06141 TaxID=1828648 RepID=UPI00187FCEAB|nr:hypothetical protein [Oculatella sp. LEGE 06141]MBE9178632.1 hypothetical protein [Oculatella sp. LEGE 06141]